MKTLSPDGSIYYVCDQPNGKSHGIRIAKTSGAVGFVSDTTTAGQAHPIQFLMNDLAVVHLPATAPILQTSPILVNALADLEDDHPEIHDVLSGKTSFEEALHP